MNQDADQSELEGEERKGSRGKNLIQRKSITIPINRNMSILLQSMLLYKLLISSVSRLYWWKLLSKRYFHFTKFLLLSHNVPMSKENSLTFLADIFKVRHIFTDACISKIYAYMCARVYRGCLPLWLNYFISLLSVASDHIRHGNWNSHSNCRKHVSHSTRRNWSGVSAKVLQQFLDLKIWSLR